MTNNSMMSALYCQMQDHLTEFKASHLNYVVTVADPDKTCINALFTEVIQTTDPILNIMEETLEVHLVDKSNSGSTQPSTPPPCPSALSLPTACSPAAVTALISSPNLLSSSPSCISSLSTSPGLSMSVSLLPPTLSPNPSPVLSETASSFPEHLHDELLRQKVPDDGEVISGDKAKKYKKEDFGSSTEEGFGKIRIFLYFTQGNFSIAKHRGIESSILSVFTVHYK